jgi:hypothetical protein
MASTGRHQDAGCRLRDFRSRHIERHIYSNNQPFHEHSPAAKELKVQENHQEALQLYWLLTVLEHKLQAEVNYRVRKRHLQISLAAYKHLINHLQDDVPARWCVTCAIARRPWCLGQQGSLLLPSPGR